MQAMVEAVKAAVLALSGECRRKNKNTEQNGETEAISHRTGPSLRQPVFKWNAKDKYMELRNFEAGVMNIFLAKHYNMNDTERVPIIKKLAMKERIAFLENPESRETASKGQLQPTC